MDKQPPKFDKVLLALKGRGVNYVLFRAYAIARENVKLWREGSFDRRYGTDTQGIIDDMVTLGVDDPELAAHACGYEGIQIPIFRKIIKDLDIQPSQFTFVDFGSGKGRAVMLAAECGFEKCVGIELSPSLHQIAQRNVAVFDRKRANFVSINLYCGDAADLSLPEGDLVCFFYNPFDDSVLRKVISNLHLAVSAHPRKLIIAYRNPVYSELLANAGIVECFRSSNLYQIYRNF